MGGSIGYWDYGKRVGHLIIVNRIITKRMETTIVIPAHNEEERVEGALRKYLSIEEIRLLVVCDGCTDNTISIVDDIARENERVSYLVLGDRLGKGGAVIEGFKHAGAEIVGFVDSDESLSPESLAELINCVKLGCDGAIASRRIKGAEIRLKQPIFRMVSSALFNVIIRVLFGLPYRDTQCGGKVFRKKAVDTVVDEMKSKGFEFDVELLWLLRKKGFDVREIPCKWGHEEKSKFRLTSGLGMIVNLLKVRFL